MAERPIENTEDLAAAERGDTLTRPTETAPPMDPRAETGRTTDPENSSMDISEGIATPREEAREEVSVLDDHVVQPEGPDGNDAGAADIANEHQADLVPGKPEADDFLSDLEDDDPEQSDDDYGFSGPVTGGPDEDPFALDEGDGLFGGALDDRLEETTVPGGVSNDPAALNDPLAGATRETDPILDELAGDDDRLSTGLDVDAPDPATPDDMTGDQYYYAGRADGHHVTERTGINSLFGPDVEFTNNSTGEPLFTWEETGTDDNGDALYEDQDGDPWTEAEIESMTGADIDKNFTEQLGETKKGLNDFWNWAKKDSGPDVPTGEGPGGEYDPDDPNWQAKVAAKNGDIDGGEWDPNLLDDGQTREYDGVDYGEDYTEPDALPDTVLTYDPFVDDGAVDPIEHDDIGPGEGDGPLPVS